MNAIDKSDEPSWDEGGWPVVWSAFASVAIVLMDRQYDFAEIGSPMASMAGALAGVLSAAWYVMVGRAWLGHGNDSRFGDAPRRMVPIAIWIGLTGGLIGWLGDQTGAAVFPGCVATLILVMPLVAIDRLHPVGLRSEFSPRLPAIDARQRFRFRIDTLLKLTLALAVVAGLARRVIISDWPYAAYLMVAAGTMAPLTLAATWMIWDRWKWAWPLVVGLMLFNAGVVEYSLSDQSNAGLTRFDFLIGGVVGFAVAQGLFLMNYRAAGYCWPVARRAA